MPTTFKAVVYSHQKRKDGTFNVKIRVTHNRKTRNLATETYVKAEQLTRGFKIKDHQVLDAMSATIKKMRDAVTAIGFDAMTMDVDQIVEQIIKTLSRKETFTLDYYKYGMDYASTRKPGTRLTYEGAFNRVLKFCGDRHPDISEVTARWVREYLAYLQREGVTSDTARLYLSKLCKVHRLAKMEFNDEDSGHIVIPGSPFSTIELPALETGRGHRNLTKKEIQKIIDLRSDDRCNSRRNICRDMFLLSFGMQGMNMVDLWDAKEDPAGYVTFRRKKTKDQHPVLMRVRIEKEMQIIFSRYASGGFLLGKLRGMYASYKSFYSTICKGMNAIGDVLGKDVPFYSARHSWATFARNDCGVDKWTVHEALCHADRATKIDDVYIAPDYSKYWDANRKVLDLFRW